MIFILVSCIPLPLYKCKYNPLFMVIVSVSRISVYLY